MGPIKSCDHFKTFYEVDCVMYVDEIHELLNSKSIKNLLPIRGTEHNVLELPKFKGSEEG